MPPEGGQGEEAGEGARLGSRRGWREDGSLLPRGWWMDLRERRLDGSCLPTGWRMRRRGWREDGSYLPTGWRM